MHVFGTEHELSEYHPVESINSKQYYLHMQEQYQLELFHSQSTFMGNGTYMHQPYPIEMSAQANVYPGYISNSPAQSAMVRFDIS